MNNNYILRLFHINNTVLWDIMSCSVTDVHHWTSKMSVHSYQLHSITFQVLSRSVTTLRDSNLVMCIVHCETVFALGKPEALHDLWIIKTGKHRSECQLSDSDIVWMICIWKTVGRNSSWNCQRFVNPLQQGVPIHRLHFGFDFLQVEEASLAM